MRVTVCVEFTEAERVIIAERRLADFIVLDRIRGDEEHPLRVRHLLAERGDDFVLATPADAKTYAARLAEALQDLKSFLDSNAEIGRTIDLDLP